MFDPIGGFERIRDLYITYLETAFRIDNPQIMEERRKLLEEMGTLCTSPFLEPVPRYRDAGWSVDKLVNDLESDERLPGFSIEERQAFSDLVLSGLFDSEIDETNTGRKLRGMFPIYQHQAEMLQRGTCQGKPGVVTSGTGSGKTESFLLPVLAMLAKEAISWDCPGEGYLKRRWWQREWDPRLQEFPAYDTWKDLPSALRPTEASPQRTPFVPQRAGENRPAAMRALILYPMNALVEDQMVRIRMALDSDLARETCTNRFKGNRFFFGRYTSSTPITDFHIHPRISASDDLKRRRSKLQSLFQEMRLMQATQRNARRTFPERSQESARFQFPTVDGSEMVSRWDMQCHPPDILITNVSMLSAMLAREVDSPIFQKTRAWIESDPEAYFFLVLDELHLQRGSAGTEVSCLLRLLLEHLGLTQPANKHKLRILASSASLPIEGKEREDSLSYLWDMFGSHGLHAKSRKNDEPKRMDWESCIVAGEAKKEAPKNANKLRHGPFVEFLNSHLGDEIEAIQPRHPETSPGEWESMYDALVGAAAPSNFAETVRTVIEESGRRLASACWIEAEARSRAKSVHELATCLFGGEGEAEVNALRGLLLARGCGDLFNVWFPRLTKLQPTSFRFHTFFRSIEGLFAPGQIEGREHSDTKSPRNVGRLDVERDVKLDSRDGNSLRRFEVLYCECCGDLFFGGMRPRVSGDEPELLPTDPDLDGLPDTASSKLFEELSHKDYAIFWPVSNRDPLINEPPHSVWNEAHLDLDTGQVRKGRKKSNSASLTDGFLYHRATRKDRHGRQSDDSGSAVPYECPSCGESYYFRERPHRLSPIRTFRAGFAKTTQLLATELFDLLRVHLQKDSAKLVSFSDSRQDAANAALDIEKRHHEDIRRQVLVHTAREYLASRKSREVAEAEIEAKKAAMQKALDAGDIDEVTKLGTEIKELREHTSGDSLPIVPLSAILESISEPAKFQGPKSGRSTLRPLLSSFVKLGIHPTDPTGTEKIYLGDDDDRQALDWHELFDTTEGSILDWYDHPLTTSQSLYDDARKAMVQSAQRLVIEIIFSKTYFSFEETGLGYACIPSSGLASDEFNLLNSFLRVFSDAYRYDDSPWGNQAPSGWQDAGDVSGKVKRFAEALWKDSSERTTKLKAVLKRLGDVGHRQGLISNSHVHLYLVDSEAPYWRCPNCRRTHLHLGVGICTRCFTALDVAATGIAAELRRHNFLARRIERPGAAVFRLHCEELTGQTDNPSERQRKFRGILLPTHRKEKEIVPYAPKEIIDLLAVTTTMEVGIDIGPLQAVFQANMPPQRFNYQQRVGRAGRRGQAFSFVLTICRSKSHDLHYFRHPEKITGDLPPPPFLTKRQDTAPRRFVRKAWLCHAFELLKQECSESGLEYPGDAMRPPDIHGEFIPTSTYFDPNGPWRERLSSALSSSVNFRDQIAAVLAASTEIDAKDLVRGLDPEGLLDEIDSISQGTVDTLQYGLAHTLAEAGYFPMYGMPTRVRNLYLGFKESEREGEFVWQTIDRDIDLSVYEHAPGAVMVKDKREHRCIGFTGPLPNTFRFNTRKSADRLLQPLDTPFGAKFWMLSCVDCGAWHRFDDLAHLEQKGDCQCGAILAPERAKECRTPKGSRTDFRPRPLDEVQFAQGRYKAICAEGQSLDLGAAEKGTNLLISYSDRSRTYRLNRGPRTAEEPQGHGFQTVAGSWQLGRYTRMPEQQVACDLDGNLLVRSNKFEADASQGPSAPFWLAAPKTTDSLFLAPEGIWPGLRLHRVGGIDPSRPPRQGGPEPKGITSVRAAALSATFLLVNRAALHLDLDPDEFDVIEPRVFRSGGVSIPLLQITDHLVNGAGFCERLAQKDGSGEALITQLIRSMVLQVDEYPLNDVLRDDHPSKCEQACYLCLHRYGNQMYHGLLDWRLGLCFLAAMIDPTFDCGLQSSQFFRFPFLKDWHDIAVRLANEMVRRFGGDPSKSVRLDGPLPAFRLSEASPDWAIVYHPLWDRESPKGVLKDAFEFYAQEGGKIAFTDTFELSRRQVSEYEWIQDEWNK